MQIDSVGTEYRTEEHSTLIIISQAVALCNHCKNRWHCLSRSVFQLPDPVSYKIHSLEVVLVSVSYGTAQYHISLNIFLHICVFSEEAFNFFQIFCERYCGALAIFAIFFLYLHYEYTDSREISNPLLLVML